MRLDGGGGPLRAAGERGVCHTAAAAASAGRSGHAKAGRTCSHRSAAPGAAESFRAHRITPDWRCAQARDAISMTRAGDDSGRPSAVGRALTGCTAAAEVTDHVAARTQQPAALASRNTRRDGGSRAKRNRGAPCAGTGSRSSASASARSTPPRSHPARACAALAETGERFRRHEAFPIERCLWSNGERVFADPAASPWAREPLRPLSRQETRILAHGGRATPPPCRCLLARRSTPCRARGLMTCSRRRRVMACCKAVADDVLRTARRAALHRAHAVMRCARAGMRARAVPQRPRAAQLPASSMDAPGCRGAAGTCRRSQSAQAGMARSPPAACCISKPAPWQCQRLLQGRRRGRAIR